MGSRTKLAVVVVLLLLLLYTAWKLTSPDDVVTPLAPPEPNVAEGDPHERPAPGEEDKEQPETAPPVLPGKEKPATAGGTEHGATPKPDAAANRGYGSVSGRVVVAGGGTRSGTRLTLTRVPAAGEKEEGNYERTVEIDLDGGFRANDLPVGDYRLEVSHPTLAAPTQRLKVDVDAVTGPLSIEFRAGGAIRVTVLSSKDQPMPDETITLSGPVSRSGKTEADGTIRFPRLPVGSYNTRWRSGTVRKLAVFEGKTAEHTFRESATLTGRVFLPDGNHPDSCLVRLQPVKYGPEGYREHQGHVGGNGTYRVHPIPPGEYLITVQVLRPDSYVVGCGSVSFQPGETVERDLRIRPTLLAGRITREDDGSPLTSKEVQVTASRVRVANGKVVEHLHRKSAHTFADKDGRYAFVGIEPGHWQIWIAPHVKELRQIYHVVEVREGVRVENVDFRVESKRLGTLRLTILGPDGKPASAGFQFTLVTLRDGNRWWTTLRAARRTAGAYEFDLDEGERTVATRNRGGYRTDPAEITAKIMAGRTVEKTCRAIRQGKVLASVRDAAGNPVEKPLFKLRTADGGWEVVSRRSMRNGVFELSLDPGEATISVWHDNRESEPVTVKVKAGETVSASFTLPD